MLDVFGLHTFYGDSHVLQGVTIQQRRRQDDPVSIARRTQAGAWTFDRILSLFPRLAARRDHRGDELSGEQQLLAIARALAANPRLVVMDEPTEGLAPPPVSAVATLIRQLQSEGTSILLAEQNAAFAVKTADHVYVMSNGTIVHASEPAALWRNEEIKTKFLGVPQTTR
jgi:branched-chain amino acid transport system ATP-binding protein